MATQKRTVCFRPHAVTRSGASNVRLSPYTNILIRNSAATARIAKFVALLGDGPRRTRLAELGQRRSQTFSLAKVIKEYEELYQRG